MTETVNARLFTMIQILGGWPAARLVVGEVLDRGVARLNLMVGQNTSLVTYVLLTTQHAASYVRLLRVVV